MATAANGKITMCGYDVFFPLGKTPFPAQKAVISKTLSALRRGENALLESPTGTGKTLALLTSTLSFQKADYAARLAEYEDLQAGSQAAAALSTAAAASAAATPGGGASSPRATVSSPVVAVKGEADCGSGSGSSSVSMESAPLSPLSMGRQRALVYKQQLTKKKFGWSAVDKLPASPASCPSPSCPSPEHQTSQPIRQPTPGQPPRTPVKSPQPAKKAVPPTRRRIYYTSRTHSQIDQVIQELRTCSDEYIDNCKISVLGSRQQLCINKPTDQVSGVSLDKHCRDLNKNMGGCRFRANAETLAYKLQANNVWDIEDAVSKGRSLRGCPYFATRSALETADLVFAPYNYLVDPHIRETMKINLAGCIVVFDEAHNIQDSCRSSASMEVAYPVFINTVQQLVKYKEISEALKALYDLCANLSRWFERTLKILHATNGFDDGKNVFDGVEVMEMFRVECGLTEESVEVFESFLPSMNEQDVNALLSGVDANDSVGKLAFEDEEKEEELSADVIFLIKKLLLTFKFLAANTDAYKLVLKRNDDSRGKRSGAGAAARGNDMDLFYNASFNLWCLSAAVSFRNMAAGAHAVVLTSGTLSPLDSFAGELGSKFPIQVETNHVIDQEKQLLVAAVTECKGQKLLGNYATQRTPEYQDAVGMSVSTTSKISPGGTLVFFPSYGFMEIAIARWKFTGQWEDFMDGRNGDRVSVFEEPRGSSDLDVVLEDYRALIDEGKKAILFAVCRGKVSEGIDFANNYARSVMVVGIPYPAVKDLHVSLKKKYQDMMFKRCKDMSKSIDSKNSTSESNSNFIGEPLSGEEWYAQQAFRAINQAVGRCIRHKADYGAIILCDPRFQEQKVIKNMSSWLRNSVTKVRSMEELLLPMRSFFSSQNNFHAVQKARGSESASTSDSRLRVPMMFAARGQTPIRSVFESCSSSSSLAAPSDPAAASGQLRLNESFQRVASRASPVVSRTDSCCQSVDQCSDTSTRAENSGACEEGAPESQCDGFEDAESLASTQDVNILSPLTPPERSGKMTCRLHTLNGSAAGPWADFLNNFDESFLSEVSSWRWKLLGGVTGTFVDSHELIADFFASLPRDAGKTGGGVYLPLEHNIADRRDIDHCVERKFFHRAAASDTEFLFSDGALVPYCGVRVVEWSWDTQRSGLLTYSEEWVHEDGVVYGVLSLPRDDIKSVVAVKVLASTAEMYVSCGAAWVHIDIIYVLCQKYHSSLFPRSSESILLMDDFFGGDTMCKSGHNDGFNPDNSADAPPVCSSDSSCSSRSCFKRARLGER